MKFFLASVRAALLLVAGFIVTASSQRLGHPGGSCLMSWRGIPGRWDRQDRQARVRTQTKNLQTEKQQRKMYPNLVVHQLFPRPVLSQKYPF
jgi:hypothetical protein